MYTTGYSKRKKNIFILFSCFQYFACFIKIVLSTMTVCMCLERLKYEEMHTAMQVLKGIQLPKPQFHLNILQLNAKWNMITNLRYNYRDRICGVLDSSLASSVADCGSSMWSNQGLYNWYLLFLRKAKSSNEYIQRHGFYGIKDNVSGCSGITTPPPPHTHTDCCFSAGTLIIPTKHVGLVQGGQHLLFP